MGASASWVSCLPLTRNIRCLNILTSCVHRRQDFSANAYRILLYFWTILDMEVWNVIWLELIGIFYKASRTHRAIAGSLLKDVVNAFGNDFLKRLAGHIRSTLVTRALQGEPAYQFIAVCNHWFEAEDSPLGRLEVRKDTPWLIAGLVMCTRRQLCSQERDCVDELVRDSLASIL